MLEELGVPFEYHRVNTRDRASYSAAFLAVSPGGKVPAIDDDGFRLFESIAINLYLAEKYKPELLGMDERERALVNQWSVWALTNLQPELLTVMSHSALLPEGDRDPKRLESSRATAAELITLLDRSLGKSEHLVGDRFTLADVNAGSVVNIAKFIGLLAGAPAANAWLERLRARPAFQRAAAT
jgi:glutathione S-transferase